MGMCSEFRVTQEVLGEDTTWQYNSRYYFIMNGYNNSCLSW